jgi:hypothetical protein
MVSESQVALEMICWQLQMIPPRDCPTRNPPAEIGFSPRRNMRLFGAFSANLALSIIAGEALTYPMRTIDDFLVRAKV